jgi:hypothetical protein
MLEKDLEDILIKYPELIEDGLKLLGRQIYQYGRRMDLLFEDKFGRKLIVELKHGPILDKHIGQILAYEGMILSADDPSLRIMLIGTRVPSNLRKALDHHGIAWRELSHAHLKKYIFEKNDKELLKFFEEDIFTDQLMDTRKHHIARDTIKVASDANSDTSQNLSLSVGCFNYKKYEPQAMPSKERLSNYNSMPARLSTDDKGDVINPFRENSKRFMCFEALRRNVSLDLLCKECALNEENRDNVGKTYLQIKKCYFSSS